MELTRIASQLVIAAQGQGSDYLDQERVFETYRFKEGYDITYLWGLANGSMQQGYFKFEREREYIRTRLPRIIEPKSFWKRNFTDWKRS